MFGMREFELAAAGCPLCVLIFAKTYVLYFYIDRRIQQTLQTSQCYVICYSFVLLIVQVLDGAWCFVLGVSVPYSFVPFTLAL